MADAVALTATNADILNAIRNQASSQYQQRVPAATQGDISGAIGALETFRPLKNEFVDALVNRIGLTVIQQKIWSNPLAEFKRGLLPFGTTIEDVFVDLIEAHRYDPNNDYENVFKTNVPDVQANFHTLNRQDYYPVTVREDLLRRAFIEENGLSQMVGAIMDAPYKSDYWDEYLIMRRLFAEFAKNAQFYKVQIADPTTATNLTQTVRTIKTYINMLRFLSPNYNAAGVNTYANPEDLVLFCTPAFDAAIDVEVMAAAFNMDKVSFLSRKVVIDDFGIDGCEAILADKEWFVCADTKIELASIQNPKALSWNYFLHHWGVYSASRFVPAIMFTTEVGTAVNVPDVTVTGLSISTAQGEPLFAPLGGDVRFVASVTGTVVPATPGVEVPQGVVWSISATESGPLAPGTFIDDEGVLHVDEHEQNAHVTIKAVTADIDGDDPIGTQTAYSEELIFGIGAAYVAP